MGALDGRREGGAGTAFITTRAVFHLGFSTWCLHIGVERGPELLELVSQSEVLPLIGIFDFLSLWHYLPGPMCLVVPCYIAILVAALCSPWSLTQQTEAWI